MGYESKLIVAYPLSLGWVDRVSDRWDEDEDRTIQTLTLHHSVEEAEAVGPLAENEAIVESWRTVATFDLSKMDGAFSKLAGEANAETKARRVRPAVYASDGDTMIWCDLYGDALGVMTLPDVIAALRADDDGYRRIAPAIALLEALDVGQFEHDGLRVLHFGH